MDTKQAYSISAWCAQNSISRALYYKLAREGKAPRTMRVGRRTLISAESALEWRQRMQGLSEKHPA